MFGSAQDERDFWKECCSKGMLAYLNPANQNFYVKKVATPVDERTSLDGGEIQIQYFPSEDQAIEFIKSFLNWQPMGKLGEFEPPELGSRAISGTEAGPKTAAESAELIQVNVYLLYDIGFGLANESVGTVQAQSLEEANEKAHNLARKVFEREHPDEKWERIDKEVKLQRMEQCQESRFIA